MSNHIVFNNCDAALKATLEAYWQKKLARLERLLVHYGPDLRSVRLTIYRHEQNAKPVRFEGRAVIQLPTGTLVAECEGRDPKPVLDRLADTLVHEIKRHRERVRKDYLFKRKERARSDLSAAGALLQRDHEIGRREDFFQLLRPHLKLLRDHAQREIRLLEIEGVLHRNELSASELLDEVLLRAWEKFADRPKRLSLDLWLTSLLHDVLNAHVQQEPRFHESFTEKVAVEPAPAVGEQQWWTALLDGGESLTLEDVLPECEVTDAYDESTAAEQHEQILTLLAKLPKPQRQALTLHLLDDYSTAEIAMLLDRPEDDVRADIQSAQRQLKEQLHSLGKVSQPQRPAEAAG